MTTALYPVRHTVHHIQAYILQWQGLVVKGNTGSGQQGEDRLGQNILGEGGESEGGEKCDGSKEEAGRGGEGRNDKEVRVMKHEELTDIFLDYMSNSTHELDMAIP